MARIKGRTVRASVLAMAALVTGGLFLPGTAQAAGTPWSVTAYNGSTSIAKANGDFANNGGVYATAGINMADTSNNGSPVYVEVKFYFWTRPFIGAPEIWMEVDKKQTSRTSSAKYVTANVSTRLRPSSSKARASIMVCEDRNNKADKCSAPSIVAFDY
ncbi:hypothetical protein ACFWN2_20795 [Lentzea sp. NPDC058436]|uniref:hypothetical protein n=1 Tax=Lentzea sp. NPDC058436 TaxID=3346499 RepID=UPI0036504D71